MEVRGLQHLVPEARGDAKVPVGKMMVNNVMRAQPAVPAKLKIETVKYMVKSAVDNESQKYSG